MEVHDTSRNIYANRRSNDARGFTIGEIQHIRYRMKKRADVDDVGVNGRIVVNKFANSADADVKRCDNDIEANFGFIPLAIPLHIHEASGGNIVPHLEDPYLTTSRTPISSAPLTT